MEKCLTFPLFRHRTLNYLQMKRKSIPFLFALALLASCSTADIAISDNLRQNSSALPVTGNAGLLINQKIAFGAYHTSPVKRGWTQRTEFSVLGIKHEKARQPIEFTQFAPNGLSADVVGSSDYNSNMFDLFKGLQHYADRFTNGFFGIIIPHNNGHVWEVLVENDNSGTALKSETDNGIAVDDRGNMIEIKGTKDLAKNKFFTDDTKTFGYELFRNNEPIAAVSVVGNGKVWIKNSLNESDQLLIASLASLLITKQNVSRNSVRN